MNIRAKLTLQFTIIVASILILFSLSVYLLSENYRREEFFNRLESRAITTVRLLVTVKEVDQNLLKIIDQNSIHQIFEEKVLVFNEENQLVYSSLDDFPLSYSNALLDEIRKKKKLQYTENNREVVGLLYPEGGSNFVAIASAFDRYGRSKLRNLGQVLLTGLLLGIGIIVLAGRVFAQQALRPLVQINMEVASITAGSLNQRIEVGNQRDEIGQLAHNFNQMLERLEAAFAIQQQFVSNASHELRTPLMAISSQLQATLSKKRLAEEYHQTLQSLLEDTRTLVDLTNGLLVLAQSGIDRQRQFFSPVRVDEAIFAAQTDLAKNFPDYHFQLEYTSFPEDENALTVLGNEQLLKTAFINFMDNACKFSPDQSVQVTVGFPDKSTIEICFADHGPGVPEEEQKSIFDPFYRASNTTVAFRGHGIGLSLCRRIIQLHNGSIRLESTPGAGSRFFVRFQVI